MTPYLQQRLEALALVTSTEPLIGYTTSVRIDSLANAKRGQSRWAAVQKAKVRTLHRMAGATMAAILRPVFERERAAAAYFVVLLRRRGPRMMDPDNAEASAKGVIDGIARKLCIDDGDPFVRYVVDQEKGPYAVRAELYVRRLE